MNRDGLTALMAVALSAPKLPHAACRGGTMHDPRELRERTEDLDYRHRAAIAVCESCPELGPCRVWLAGLAPQDRPSGTVTAGVVVEEVRLSNVRQAEQDRVRAALEADPGVGVSELADRLGVPRNTVRHARRKMAAVG